MASVIYEWLFKRLPRLYSVFFLLIAVPYYVFVFPLFAYRLSPWLAAHVVPGATVSELVLQKFGAVPILSALFTLAFAGAGIIIANACAAWIYGQGRSRKARNYPNVQRPPVSLEKPEGLLAHYHRVGIILAGGGAKGAYQAGAIRAIYEFLEREEALSKVKMIAGTSIGSWNALFWLAAGFKPQAECDIERWWNSVNVSSIIEPVPYIPGRQNYFLSTAPWREEFERLFGEDTEWGKRLLHHVQMPDAEGSIHFYLTRSNVGQARLEFTTNNEAVDKTAPNMKGPRPRLPIPTGTYAIATSLQDIKEAVFSSMDLPPLFRYSQIRDQYFEDGGVVDNLPIRFGTEVESCDLLFVIPLNATFAQNVNQNSIFMRMYRVMDVRQGVLERNSFKMLYLYNELAALRDALEESDRSLVSGAALRQPGANASLENEASAIKDAKRRMQRAKETEGDEAVARGLRRKNEPVHVFSICPAPELQINTAEFWKTKEAGQAFRRMYEVTADELIKHFRNPPDAVEVVLVTPELVSYFRDF